MNWIITNWENDMIDTPEELVSKFVFENYNHYDFKLLSGLKHRDKEDLFESLNESRAIIMQPSLLDERQIKNIVSLIGQPVYHNTLGRETDWMIKDFIFLSANPFEDLTIIKTACKGEWDSKERIGLGAILEHCYCSFYGFGGEHYELKFDGYSKRDFYAIRYK